jgi:hypothetical protein
MSNKSGPGSGMNKADHISESLKKLFFGLKYLKFFDVDPGWEKFGSGMGKSRIQDKHPGSATLVTRSGYNCTTTPGGVSRVFHIF